MTETPHEALGAGAWPLQVDGGRVLYNGAPLPLGAADAALLAALVEADGRPLDGRSLMALEASRLGRDTEAAGGRPPSLWDHVSTINRVLGEHGAGHVAHHPAHGFTLVAPSAPAGGRPRALPLPLRTPSIYGRDETIVRLTAQVPTRRFVTVVGAGGMGKTTVALAVAERLAPTLADGAVFVDLAALTGPAGLTTALVSALGATIDTDIAALTAYLRRQRLLLLLDGCERFVDAVAPMVETLLAAAPGLLVLATSREPLLAAGEWLHRLAPMPLPAQGAPIDAAQAMASPAVQLFVDRIRARDDRFMLDDTGAPLVAAVCRRLDGVPLAIELAAAQAAGLGLRRLATQLESRLLGLTGARRAGPRRHRTLVAMLDWSYELLTGPECAAFRHLAVFRGSFTLASASAVVGESSMATATVVDLVAKSLVTATDAEGGTRLRLLDTTRAYAAEKLEHDPEQGAVRARHARHLCDLLKQAESAWDGMTRAEWRRAYAPMVDDVRAALDWALSPEGDLKLGLTLVVAAYSLADQTGLLIEYRNRITRAIEMLPLLQPRDPLLEMRVRVLPAYMLSPMMVGDPSLESTLRHTLRHALGRGSPRDGVCPLVALWWFALLRGRYPLALRRARQIGRLGEELGDPAAVLVARRMQAQTLHFQGHQATAQVHAEEALANAALRIPLAYLPSSVDLSVSMRVVLARIAWLQGRADRAVVLADECLLVARADTAVSLCQALALCAIPIALWRGDTARARRFVDELHDVAYWSEYWQLWVNGFNTVLGLHAGNVEVDTAYGSDSLASMPRDHLATFDLRLASVSWRAAARVHAAHWCTPEALRADGEAWRTSDAPDAIERAAACFRQAIALARRQGALAWELRAATSLARLRQPPGATARARARLAAVLGRFAEGLSTVDVVTARTLLGLPGPSGARP